MADATPVRYESLTVIKPTLTVYRKGEAGHIFKWNDTTDLEEYFYGVDHAIFIVHGYMTKTQSGWPIQLRDELMKEGMVSKVVVYVSWGDVKLHGANTVLYRTAAANTEVVGKWLGRQALAVKQSHSSIYIHGIGHSLGSHLLGFAGRTQKRLFNRISALDPAGPYFEEINMEKRLGASDADMVDVIHTDGYCPTYQKKFSPVNHYGTLIPIGTVDYYPNFGISPQPGTGNAIAGSHARATDLYIWSVANPGRFVTKQQLDGTPVFEKPVYDLVERCEAEMGYFANYTHNGNYYIKTNDKAPWSV